jgi:hypothetical protein
MGRAETSNFGGYARIDLARGVRRDVSRPLVASGLHDPPKFDVSAR